MDSASGLPISRVISSARSSIRSVISAKARRRISPRSRGAIAANPAWAATAAASASIPSSGPASATSQSTLPVAGSSTGSVAPDVAGRHDPPMNSPVSTWSITRASSLEFLVMAEIVPSPAAVRTTVVRAGRHG